MTSKRIEFMWDVLAQKIEEIEEKGCHGFEVVHAETPTVRCPDGEVITVVVEDEENGETLYHCGADIAANGIGELIQKMERKFVKMANYPGKKGGSIIESV